VWKAARGRGGGVIPRLQMDPSPWQGKLPRHHIAGAVTGVTAAWDMATFLCCPWPPESQGAEGGIQASPSGISGVNTGMCESESSSR
jgi:hypothetical protein